MGGVARHSSSQLVLGSTFMAFGVIVGAAAPCASPVSHQAAAIAPHRRSIRDQRRIRLRQRWVSELTDCQGGGKLRGTR